jgi:AAA ATPase domain
MIDRSPLRAAPLTLPLAECRRPPRITLEARRCRRIDDAPTLRPYNVGSICTRRRDTLMRVLFGRSGAFERIDRLLASARAGQSGAMLILGEPGIGKTALLEVARARGEAMQVLATRGVPSEADIPFAGLLELLRPLLGGLDGLPERQAQALSGALGIGSPVPGDRFLIGAATLTLLAAAAESEPVLILVDDAHWLDGESLDALLFAVRRLDADAVAGLIAARPEELRLETVEGLDTLELGALDATDTARLAESHLGRRLDKHDEARIFRLTRGNPLAVIEIGASEEALAFDAPGRCRVGSRMRIPVACATWRRVSARCC